MAYVGISTQLLDEVKHKIHEMKSKEKDAFATPADSLTVSHAPEEIIMALWGEHRHLEPILPDKWKVKNTSVDLRFIQTGENGTTLCRTYFIVRYDNEVMAPPNVCSHRFDINLPENTYSSIPEAEAYFKYSMEQASIERRWNKVHKELAEFLTSCKSLNEALKLWPDVRIYIPTKYLERVEQKTERAKTKEAQVNKAAAALAAMDIDGAISAAMTSRLMGTMQGLK